MDGRTTGTVAGDGYEIKKENGIYRITDTHNNCICRRNNRA